MKLIPEKYTNWRQLSRWILLSILSGLLAGAAATVFLFALAWAGDFRDQHMVIIWALPLAGLLIGLAYDRLGQPIAPGNNLIIDEIHDPKKVIPARMAPFILLGTVITHLFGGSAGREGTAVQMGASLSDQLSHLFHLKPEERRMILAAGAGAGFGAAIGTPLAGAIFGLEAIRIGRLETFAWFECLIASCVAFGTALLLRAPHTLYPTFIIDPYDIKAMLWIVVAGALFGLTARAFVLTTHGVEKLSKKLISQPALRPFIGGLILVALYWLEGSYQFVGLGLAYIQDALVNRASLYDPALKSIFTALTVGTGFKGGEFIPLVFIGSTLGSALSILIPISFKLLAAVGFAAVFAGAANTPLACSFMAMEIFGWNIAPYALIGCFVSYYCSGYKSIYSAQRRVGRKWF